MLRIIVAAGAFWLAIANAGAQELGDAARGRAFAQQVCARCHGVVPGAPSARAGAANFYTIAMTPGMSPLALRVALETSHRSMPNLILSRDETRDVIAYIISLQPRK